MAWHEVCYTCLCLQCSLLWFSYIIIVMLLHSSWGLGSMFRLAGRHLKLHVP